jgi:bile acid-coenzyme A ligase
MVIVNDDGRESPVTWRQLDADANRLACLLRREDAGSHSLVIIALPTGAEHFVAAIAAWRLGACVLPLNPDMPPLEREKMIALARDWRPSIIVGNWTVAGTSTIELKCLSDLNHLPQDPCVDLMPCPGKAIGSGGSTGTPKIIVDPKPWAHVPGRWGALSRAGLRASQIQLVVGSLYHNVGFMCGHIGLFEGHTLIIPKRFSAAQAADLIERHGVQFAGFLPIMMQRIAKLPPVRAHDFSSIEGFYHSGGVCADWVKRYWLNLVRPEHLWELYGATEDIGITMISGSEWLERPGSVGRPFQTDVLILDHDEHVVPTGEIGEIHMRNAVVSGRALGENWPQDPSFMYVGAPQPKRVAGGFRSVGDLGWVGSDGYLYLADRRVDMIKTGGINVYPAEVEAALSEHPEIQDVVVIGVPDSEWGQRVHALIQPATWPALFAADELDTFCRQRLTAHKAPKSYELFHALPRDASGKIRRSALREERLAGRFPGVVPAPKSNHVPRATHAKTTS